MHQSNYDLGPAATADGEALRRLFDPETIYIGEAALAYPRTGQVLARFADAEQIIVPSHRQIPHLSANSEAAESWNRIKRSVLVLDVRKTLRCEPNELSSDFTAPSIANGCAMACLYCYVARHKGFANPITTFVNIEAIAGFIERHAERQGRKLAPTTADPQLWVYELGCNSDCSVDAAVSDNLKDLIALFRRLPNAKGTFATKYVNRQLLTEDPQKKMRIRLSLMPEPVARQVDIRTSPIRERVQAVNDFVEAGWEVNLNFAPVIYYEGWLADWQHLFEYLADALTPAVKAQLQAEIIFLTHNEGLHKVNQIWNPRAEALIWQPQWQEAKSGSGDRAVLRYHLAHKRRWRDQLQGVLAQVLPQCQVRYAF